MEPRYITADAARAAAVEVLEEAVDPPQVWLFEDGIRCDGIIAWNDALAMLAGHEAIDPDPPADPEVEVWSVHVRDPRYVVTLVFDREGRTCAAGLWDDIDLLSAHTT